MAQEYFRNETQTSFPAMDALATGMDTLTSRVKQLGEFNSERLAKAREFNRHWMDRAVAEAKLTMEMNSKISSVHSFTDAMNLYQQWANQRLQAASEDVSYALSAGREMMEAATRALAGQTNGGPAPSDSTVDVQHRYSSS